MRAPPSHTEPAIPVRAILVGLPRSIEEKLTAHSHAPVFELIGCVSCRLEQIMPLLAADRTNVVLIDSTQTWATGLARALRTQHPDVKLLILADPARMLGYVLYDFDHLIENAGEDEVIDAIRATAAGRPVVRD